jgi:hypothetical protein
MIHSAEAALWEVVATRVVVVAAALLEVTAVAVSAAA